MVIDGILDRRDGEEYEPDYLYEIAETDEFDDITKAFDNKDEDELKKALHDYIDDMRYNYIPGIHQYIDSQEWIINESDDTDSDCCEFSECNTRSKRIGETEFSFIEK